jgi:hypothetical protein
MPPYGKRCLEAPKQPPFWLELQAKHLQEVAEFERLTQSSWAELRRKQGAELDAAIQLLQTDKIQQHKHHKYNSYYNAVPPPPSLTAADHSTAVVTGQASATAPELALERCIPISGASSTRIAASGERLPVQCLPASIQERLWQDQSESEA